MRRRQLLLASLLLATPGVARAFGPGSPPDLVAFVGSSTTAGVGASSPALAYPALTVGFLAERVPGRLEAVVSGHPGADGAPIAEAAVAILDLRPRALVLQIGSNAALRGEDPESLNAPLQTALAGCEARRIPVLVLGPQHAPAIRPERHAAVERVLEVGARQHRARWLARRPGLPVGPDGLHHDDAGHDALARLVADALLPMLFERPA